MSQDRPTLEDLLTITREFVASTLAELPADMRYQAQVAIYLLGIAEREIRHGGEHASRANARIACLLGNSGSTAALVELLCAGIRRGDFDADWTRALEAVLDVIVGKVAIVRPDRLHPMHGGIDVHHRAGLHQGAE